MFIDDDRFLSLINICFIFFFQPKENFYLLFISRELIKHRRKASSGITTTFKVHAALDSGSKLQVCLQSDCVKNRFVIIPISLLTDGAA